MIYRNNKRNLKTQNLSQERLCYYMIYMINVLVDFMFVDLNFYRYYYEYYIVKSNQ